MSLYRKELGQKYYIPAQAHESELRTIDQPVDRACELLQGLSSGKQEAKRLTRMRSKVPSGRSNLRRPVSVNEGDRQVPQSG